MSEDCPYCGKPMSDGDAAAAGCCSDCYWRMHDEAEEDLTS